MSEDLDLTIPGHPGLYRVPRSRSGLDPSTRRLLLLAGGLAGALLVALAGWSVLVRRGAEAVPVIQADSRPVRVRPEQPGGLQVAGQNLAILSGDGAGDAESLAPPPEVPEPQAMQSQSPQAMQSQSPQAMQPQSPQAMQPAAPDSAAAPAPAAAVDAGPTSTAPLPAAAPAAPAPAPVVTQRAMAKPPTAAAHVTMVQFAALDSEAAASGEWQRLSRRLPTLLDRRQPVINKVERDGRSFWRLRTGGFTTIAQATEFCGQVRAKGAACAIASF